MHMRSKVQYRIGIGDEGARRLVQHGIITSNYLYTSPNNQ
jgi:hypothetical protein